jgi:hypothetical protein
MKIADSREYKLLKAKWEFLRRNKEYKKAWKEALQLRKEYGHSLESESLSQFYYTYYGAPRALSEIELQGQKKETELCKRFDLKSCFLIDPNMDVDKLIDIKGGYDQWFEFENAKNIFFDHPVTIKMSEIDFKNPHYGNFRVSIDFSKVTSHKQIKSLILGRLENLYKYHAHELKKKGMSKKQAYAVDYDTVLKVGELKERSMSNQEIAKKIFPKEIKVNPESAIRKVSHYHKTYKEHVNGGYRNIQLF